MSAYRRENPAKPPAVVVPPQPPVPPAGGYPVAPDASIAFDGTAVSAAAAPPPSEATVPPPPAMPPYTYAGAAAAAAPVSGLLITQPRAQFRDRLAAFVLDVILIGIVVSFLDSLNGVDADNVMFPFLLIYLIAMWTFKQTSVGGIICQLRLVRVDGSPLTFADALVRGLSGIFSLAVLALGALWILRDPERQAWHDKIAGTYVVKVPRNWPV
jgi:uncharacterized RDD family membrane protein YckC